MFVCICILCFISSLSYGALFVWHALAHVVHFKLVTNKVAFPVLLSKFRKTASVHCMLLSQGFIDVMCLCV